ncbi:Rapid ALkalinization Factor [Dillenia turbinata]|uniref:Rapid ALkalinization Factor n=1 Tax=Dillenia turbinata TaxID=194707 RepID=A0AAN8VRX1_9MAGN
MATSSKAFVTFCTVALLFSSTYVEFANATKYIGSPVLRRDKPVKCQPGQDSCAGKTKQPYNRGCEKTERCRGQLDSPPTEGDLANKLTGSRPDVEREHRKRRSFTHRYLKVIEFNGFTGTVFDIHHLFKIAVALEVVIVTPRKIMLLSNYNGEYLEISSGD